MKQKELVGQQVFKQYRVTRLMDEGGMGVLYQAQHETQPERKIVLKVFNPEVVQDATAYARARMEAEVISAIRHPHIARIQGFDELPNGLPYMVVEYLEGEGLGARLRRKPMSPPVVGRMLKQLGGALQEVHDQEIFHRDLKPGYVFLVNSGDDDDPQVKLLNFGISKIRDPRTPHRSRTAFGRAYFTSPEQLGQKLLKLDRTTDIFSMGCITYLALTGEVPFPARSLAKYVERVASKEPASITERVPGMPAEADAVLRRAMARRREDRYPKVEEFVDQLMEVIDRVPLEPPADEPPASSPAEEREAPHGLTPEEAEALPRVVPAPAGDLPGRVDLSGLVRSVPPSPVHARPLVQPFEDQATVLMDGDELPPRSTPPGRPRGDSSPVRPAHDSSAPQPQADASFLPRKTAIAPPLEPEDDGEHDEEEIVLRDVSESDEDGTTTNLMGVDELECEDQDEDVTDLIPLGELLKDAGEVSEDEDATVISIDLKDVEEVSEDEAAAFKDTVASPAHRPADDEFVDAPTTQYEEPAVSPRTEFSDGIRLKDVSSEVDEEAETEIHSKSPKEDED